MSYTNWLRDLAKLPAEAQFCLMDVDEQISSGDHVLKFKITEAKGKDPVEGYKGREEDVCRPRMYFGYGDTDMMSDGGGRLEITEQPRISFDRACIRDWNFSVHEFYIMHQQLCDSVLTSLQAKIGIVADGSKMLLEAQLGSEIDKLITLRLQGGDVEDTSFKKLLVGQLADKVMVMVKPVRRAVFTAGDPLYPAVNTVSFSESDDLLWEYNRNNNGFDLEVSWKTVKLSWRHGQASGQVNGNIKEMCVREMFLCMVNLPSFGQAIAAKMAKII